MGQNGAIMGHSPTISPLPPNRIIRWKKGKKQARWVPAKRAGGPPPQISPALYLERVIEPIVVVL
jgi:hypothetical protein